MSDLGKSPQEENPIVDDTKEEIQEEKIEKEEKKDKKDKKLKKWQEEMCVDFGPQCQMDPKKVKKYYKMKQMRKMMKFMNMYYGFPDPYRMYNGIQPPPNLMNHGYEMGPPPGLYGPPK